MGLMEEIKKIPWVIWEDVCKPKELGGLRVRDIRVFNFNLPRKCRWRLLEAGSV